MKRWAIRLSALTAVIALGWFTVAWAQRQVGPGEMPPEPDFSKPPVNAAAAAAANGAASDTAMSGGTGGVATPVSNNAPVDPFQSAANRAGERYRNVEPREFQPDPNASALATDTSEIATKQAAHNDIPPAQVVGIGNGNNAASGADDATKPADPFGLNRGNGVGTVAVNNAGDQAKSQPAGSGLQHPDDAGYGRYSANPSATDASPPPSFGGDAPPSAVTSSRGAERDDNAPLSNDDGSRQNPALDNHRGNGLRNDLNDNPPDGHNPSQDVGANSRDENILPPRGGQNDLAPANDALGPLARSTPNATPPAADIYGAPASTPANVEGHGRPGDKKLEGAQSPSVTIQKIAPAEIQVGKPAKFEIVVRNTGPVVAENVEVIDAVPQGTTLVSTNPQTQAGQRGEIVWKVGELKPAEEAKLQVELMPVAEGEIGSVAVVQFRSSASVRTIATKPELVLELNSPKQVMIGGDVTIGIKISNPGTGAAEKIVLHEVVPPGFQHPAGSELEFDVGMLKPGESRPLELTLHAVQAGPFTNTITVNGDANLHAEQTAQIQVIAPALEVAIDGPGLRYLERQAKYNVSVNNPGTAPAKDVELVTRLPKGMQFVEASDKGHYDASSHSVVWSLAELPAGQSGSVTLTALAAEPGEQKLRGEGRAAGGLSHTTEETTIVEGVAAVLFTVVDVDDPVEVGGQATYEIRVVNQGSKAASRVMVGAQLPRELKPVSAEGPSPHRIDQDRVVFEPLARLAPKADITYRIVAQGVSPGDSRIKVQLQTEEMSEPVTKEESTRVYMD